MFFLEHADLLSKFELLDWKRMIYIVKMSVFIKSVQCEFNKILFEKEEPNHDNVNIYLTKLMFSEWKMFFCRYAFELYVFLQPKSTSGASRLDGKRTENKNIVFYWSDRTWFMWSRTAGTTQMCDIVWYCCNFSLLWALAKNKNLLKTLCFFSQDGRRMLGTIWWRRPFCDTVVNF